MPLFCGFFSPQSTLFHIELNQIVHGQIGPGGQCPHLDMLANHPDLTLPDLVLAFESTVSWELAVFTW